MRVLVTGATGFVGSAVARALVAGGHEVTGLVRDPGRARAALGDAVTMIRGDMLDTASYVPAVSAVDSVIHTAQLAVPGRLTRAKAERLFAADSLMTRALAAECLRSGTRLIYTGGCFDWGDHGDEIIDERTPLAPSPLGVGHARQAGWLDTQHAEHGLDVVRLSPGFVYGPGGLFAEAFVDQARRGRLRCIGDGSNWWSCIHVDDLADAYVAAVTTATPGSAYAVVDSEPLRLKELTDLTTDAMGIKRTGNAPPFLLSVFLGPVLVASLVTSFRIRSDRLRNELGWTPRHERFRDHVAEVIAATP